MVSLNQRQGSRRVPSYLPKIVADLETGHVLKGLVIADVFPDDWCDVFKGKLCNCNPEVRYSPPWGELPGDM